MQTQCPISQDTSSHADTVAHIPRHIVTCRHSMMNPLACSCVLISDNRCYRHARSVSGTVSAMCRLVWALCALSIPFLVLFLVNLSAVYMAHFALNSCRFSVGANPARQISAKSSSEQFAKSSLSSANSHQPSPTLVNSDFVGKKLKQNDC